MDEGEPDFLMSLNDTLTCGFGASVLLFIVFVILVALQDTPATAVGELEQARTRSGASINPADIKSDDPLLVRVRADCDFIKSLKPPAEGGFATVKLKDGRKGADESCVAIFRLSEPPTRRLPFTAGKQPDDVVLVTVLLGAVVLTPGTVKVRYYEWPTNGQPEVFAINLNDLERLFRLNEGEPVGNIDFSTD